MTSEERDDLARFVLAQERGGSFDVAWAELRTGRKVTHWMWWIFPQLAGLGSSERARHFAISSLAHARAYLDHPVLGARLRACARVLLEVKDRSAADIFGPLDAMKLRSCMTLFATAAPEDEVFRAVLDRYFDGAEDPRSLELLGLGNR